MSNQSHILTRNQSDNSTRDKLVPDISPDDFPNFSLEDTPLYEIYGEDTTDAGVGLAGKT